MPSLDQLFDFDRYIDTKAPGFSARVLLATHWQSGQDVAFKVMRREHLANDEVWRLFANEVQLLEVLRQANTVNRMVDCGFVSDQTDDRPAGGDVASCGRQIAQFYKELPRRMADHWRPYIAVELLPEEHSLLNLIRGADGAGFHPLRLPTDEGLALAMQFAYFLRGAHALELVYWDHKPEHVYWDGKRLRIIDLNISRRLSPDMSVEAKAAEKSKDLRHLVVGVLYTVFTGRDFRFRDGSLEAAPSMPNTVEQRFVGAGRLDFGENDYLMPDLCDLLNRFADPQAADLTAEALLNDLRHLAARLGWDAGPPTSDDARAARGEIHKGLAALRQAQAGVNAARQHFLNANALNPDDRDSERLYRDAGEFYQHRVLP